LTRGSPLRRISHGIGVPLPVPAAWGVVMLETVGALLLILGLGTRILGVLFAAEMLVVIVAVRRGPLALDRAPSL